MIEDIKGIGSMVASILPIRIGMFLVFGGLFVLFAVFSEFEVTGLLVAVGAVLVGMLLVWFGISSVEIEKRKLFLSIVMIILGAILLITPLFFSIAIWGQGLSWSSPPAKKEILPLGIWGEACGLIILSAGIFILNSIKGDEAVAEKIAGISKRNPLLVLLFSIVTFGIYHIWWLVQTRKEINKCGAFIPTPWLLIIPVIGLYFLYKFADGFSYYITKDESPRFWFNFYIFLWPVTVILIQKELNKRAL